MVASSDSELSNQSQLSNSSVIRIAKAIDTRPPEVDDEHYNNNDNNNNNNNNNLTLSCHQCQDMKPIHTLTYCLGAPHNDCDKKYCSECLNEFYDIISVENPSQWYCPACKGVCSCAICYKTHHNTKYNVNNNIINDSANKNNDKNNVNNNNNNNEMKTTNVNKIIMEEFCFKTANNLDSKHQDQVKRLLKANNNTNVGVKHTNLIIDTTNSLAEGKEVTELDNKRVSLQARLTELSKDEQSFKETVQKQFLLYHHQRVQLLQQLHNVESQLGSLKLEASQPNTSPNSLNSPNEAGGYAAMLKLLHRASVEDLRQQTTPQSNADLVPVGKISSPNSRSNSPIINTIDRPGKAPSPRRTVRRLNRHSPYTSPKSEVRRLSKSSRSNSKISPKASAFAPFKKK